MLYRFNFNQSFNVDAENINEARKQVKSWLIDLLNDDWFTDSDFRLVDLVYPSSLDDPMVSEPLARLRIQHKYNPTYKD